MHLTCQFQGQTVKGQGWRRAGAYRVGRTPGGHTARYKPLHFPCLTAEPTAPTMLIFNQRLTRVLISTQQIFPCASNN